MQIKLKRCADCGALGVGPNAARLYPFEGRLLCERGTAAKPGCWRQALNWHANRPAVIAGLASYVQFLKDAAQSARVLRTVAPSWEAYISELCELAFVALELGDLRTFEQYLARAMQAWDLKEKP